MQNLLLLIERKRKEGLIKKYSVESEGNPYIIAFVDYENKKHGITKYKFERYRDRSLDDFIYERFVIETKEDYDRLDNGAILKRPDSDYQLGVIRIKNSLHNSGTYMKFFNDSGSDPFVCPFEDLIGWEVKQPRRIKFND